MLLKASVINPISRILYCGSALLDYVKVNSPFVCKCLCSTDIYSAVCFIDYPYDVALCIFSIIIGDIVARFHHLRKIPPFFIF